MVVSSQKWHKAKKDRVHILQSTSGSYDFKKIRKVLINSYPDKILKKYDNENAAIFSGRGVKASWHNDSDDSNGEEDPYYYEEDWDYWGSESGTSTL